MPAERDLDWEGGFNVRDLGGLKAAGGRRIRRGAVVRSEAPDAFTDKGWDALRAHGIRTLVDLREPEERPATDAPAGLDIVHLPLDDPGDTAFWSRWGDGLDCTPLYYRDFLERRPHRCAAAVSAVAHARPGGVLVHCAGGRDRTGLVVLVLLRLVGVPDDEIVADYLHSHARLAPLWLARGHGDQAAHIRDLLEEHGTTPAEALRTALDGLDAEAVLRAGGLTDHDLDTLRHRMLERPRSGSGLGAG